MSERHDRHYLEAVPPPPDDDGYGPTTPTRTPRDLAERAVLGAMLRDPHARDEATQTLTGTDFHDARYEQIWDAIVHLYSRAQPVDTLTVADHLGNQLPKIGGQAELEQLHYEGLAVIDPGYYADLVAKHAARDRLTAAAQRIQALTATDGDIDLDAALAEARNQLDSIAQNIPGVDTPTTTNTWAPVDLADIIDNGEVLEQPTHLARHDGQCLLYPAAVHSISGEPESGKTWVALIAAAQVLRDPDARHVTYVDFEDRAGRVIPRLIQLGAPRIAILDRFHYIRPTAALDTPGRTHLDHAAAQSSLAVIDGVTEAMTMHGLSLMDNEDAARYLDLLPRHLADQGCSVLQIDHVVKDSEKQGRWAIGAGHKLAGLDGAAYGVKVLEPFGRGKTGRAAITVHKDRPGAVREIATGNAVAHLVIDSTQGTMSAWLEPPSTMPTGPSGEMRPTHLMEKVSRYIEITPGCSGADIESAVKGKTDYVRMALQALIREEFVTVVPGERGKKCHTSEVRFRESEDDQR